MLRAQGWQPGEYLGAKDAPHAEWHTEANSTHIRVTLKDDTLGLGAKRNNGNECTGLDAFQHLLGRLNGKSDDTLEAEQKARTDVKLSLYVQQKLGTIRFVKGGWLVGDQVKDTPDEEVEQPQDGTVSDASKDSADVSEPSEPVAVKPKKRKADQDTDREDEKARKKEKKSKKRKADSDGEVDDESAKKDKKSKRRKEKEKAREESAQSTSAAVSEAGETSGEVDSSAEAKKLKKERKEKKKEKKDKKEKKEKRRKEKAADSGAETSDNIPKKKKKDGANSDTPAESSISTPSGSGTSTPVTTSSRYLARSRFIAQKRMAFADTAALNQVRERPSCHHVKIG
jgi:Pin2-interacting protein X1